MPALVPAAVAVLREAAAAGVVLRLGPDGEPEFAGDPSPELLAKLREYEPEITSILAATLWTDRDAWCTRLAAAGVLHERRHVLRAWADAAGGWTTGEVVYLPPELPRNLTLATLKAHAMTV